MGFRSGAYAKVWEIKNVSDTCTRLRISISRKNKKTDEYEQDFSGFVDAIGTAAAAKAMKLREGDRIKLGDTDVSTKYIKEKKTSYTNFKIFSFDIESDSRTSNMSNNYYEPQPEVDSGEVEDHDLPF